MFCSKCGMQLPDEANFCWKCGQPQKEGAEVEEPQLETCEIVYQVVDRPIFGGGTFMFWAEAIGSKGRYNAGESPVLRGQEGPPVAYGKSERYAQALKGLEELVSKLTGDGWEYLGSYGESRYWQMRFRRRVR